MVRTLFLAWQDRSSRVWYPVGRLTSTEGVYTFEYINGAAEAQKEAGFQALPYFPNLTYRYESRELFPLFSNRVLPKSRPEYADFLKWLAVGRDGDPIAILARSGGQRATDAFEVFPCPEETNSGEYRMHFLVHGLSHMSLDSIARANKLQPGEELLIMKDVQNSIDRFALALRTSEKRPGDIYIIGYCPRYLCGDLLTLMDGSSQNMPQVTVEQVNLDPAPLQFRVLCQVRMQWSAGFSPFSGKDYQPLATSNASLAEASLVV